MGKMETECVSLVRVPKRGLTAVEKQPSNKAQKKETSGRQGTNDTNLSQVLKFS